MKKILLAFDGKHFSDSLFEFVKQLNKRESVMATGIFLPVVDYSELLYSFGGMAGPVIVNYPEQDELDAIRKNIDRFEALCKEFNIKYTVHAGFTRHVIEQIKLETRFADLLVLSPKTFYENLGVDIKDDYLENVLHKAECPIILIPEVYRAPQNIVISYDGSEASVHAIKQFAYLFPEYKDLQTLMVYFNKSAKDIPERELLEEFASLHFDRLTIFKLKISPKKDMEQWLLDNGDTMLVAGAYSRSLFSELIRKSFITEVIKGHRIPIFVAHQ